ncbi:MAG TPA: glycosyltransferase family 4 protein [Bryobacteraceae bacterium]|nr:glycosyltransferase family 4 protein [Bryobacteraceae bacterium]
MRLRFLTSTPLSVTRGSGTFVGIQSLVDALRALGTEVDLAAPGIHLPVYTLERLLFNERLRWSTGGDWDATVGFDLDGYRVAGRSRTPHIASLKGVIADELRMQKGLTWATMAVQARCEAAHARRADAVVTTSIYSAERAQEAYQLRERPRIVPELIDLAAWRRVLAANLAQPDPRKFTVLCVCRLYRRKRVNLLVEAAGLVRGRIPELRVRIVGDGPEREEFQRVWREKGLEETVQFLGDVTQAQLAAEYNGCDLFCLPSVQEGFGIVFLEAMAAGKAIVAARAAAIPEVVRHGVLVDPDSAEALAAGIEGLYGAPEGRADLVRSGSAWVEQFDAPRVAGLFLEEIRRVSGSNG